jgi:hypothetical protein
VADRTIYTNECALNEAEVISLSLANPAATPTPTVGKLRFFDAPLVPDVTTTQAELVAAETLLGGYPAGGYDLDDFGNPLLVSGGGAAITSPVVTVAFTVAPGASLAGGWVEDPDGDVRAVFIFDPPRPLNVVGEGFQFVRQLLYGRNPS